MRAGRMAGGRIDPTSPTCAPPWRWRGAAWAPPGLTPRSAASSSATAASSAGAPPQPGGRPHAEPVALAMAGEQARGRHRLCHAGTVLPLGPLAPLHRCADRGRHRPRRGRHRRSGPAGQRPGAGAAPGRRDRGRDRAAARPRPRDPAGLPSRITLGRPMVTLKLATTLDGRIATARRREPVDHRHRGAPHGPCPARPA